MRPIGTLTLSLTLLGLQACVTSSKVSPELGQVEEKRSNLYSIREIIEILKNPKSDNLNTSLKKSKGISLQTYEKVLSESFQKLEESGDNQKLKKLQCEKNKFNFLDFDSSSKKKFPLLTTEQNKAAQQYFSILNLHLVQECMRLSYADTVYRYVEFTSLVHSFSNQITLTKVKSDDPYTKQLEAELVSYDAFLKTFTPERFSGISQEQIFLQESQFAPQPEKSVKDWIETEIKKNGPFNPESIEFPGNANA